MVHAEDQEPENCKSNGNVFRLVCPIFIINDFMIGRVRKRGRLVEVLSGNLKWFDSAGGIFSMM